MPQRFDQRVMFGLAVRLLSQLAEGQSPSRRDAIVLRRLALVPDGDLPIQDLCCRMLRQYLHGQKETDNTAMTKDEVERLRELAGKARYLAHQRDIRRISEEEYVALLNCLRKEHCLWPLHPQPTEAAIKGRGK